ncbi:DsrC family protein [Moraxella macacae 0408225]|uniref:Sulfurtransferase n=1 Tax=Moraxella macacae 0408225 TaxID=1230338 RepID=L2F7J1_9GAMM|nr:TusE/DsrC/DsvC family sulfur relay protein [Moraxella macacae]ELA08428.1 DsrC family protein [Moraxella macacae 0408225]
MTNLTNITAELDCDGHLADPNDWTPDIAKQLAKNLEIQLDETHFLVLSAVRDYYQAFSHSPTTRPLIKYLSQTLPNLQLDNAKLQTLFNTGLVARHVNRLAGLPKPANCL